MKRVLIISYYWPPSGGAGVQRWLKFAKFLPKFGWQPVILSVDPDYATYPVRDQSLEKEISGEIQVIRTKSRESFSAYKRVSGSEKIPYAGFANEKHSTTFKQKVARFIRGNFFLPDPRKGWNKFALIAARELIANEKIDAIITSSPPHSTQLIGLKLANEYKIPWLADLRDPWTDIYYYKQFYPSGIAHRINLKMERTILENASTVITVSSALKKLFEEKLNASEGKIQVITNGYDPDDFKNLSAPSKDKFIITYVGSMADIYPLDSFLVAFSNFLKENPGAKLRFIGTLAPAHLIKVKALPAENIELIGYVDHQSAIQYMSSSSVLLLIIPDNDNNQGIITGKLFEYMAVRRPILFIGPKDGDGAAIIKETGSGEVVSYMEADRMYELLSSWNKNIVSQSPDASYSREALSKKLVQILDGLTASN